MRPKKSKKIRKALQKLERSFAFRKPFQLLLDDMLLAYLDKVNFPITVINNTFNYPKLFTSRCLYKKCYGKGEKSDNSVKENDKHESESVKSKLPEITEALKEEENEHKTQSVKLQGNQTSKTAMKFAKHIEIRNCLHKNEVTPAECIRKFVKKSNANHYFLGCILNNNKYKGLKNVPLVIFRRNGTLLLDTDSFDKKESQDDNE
ncbi:putative proteins of PilT/Vapc superfamily [Trachipleistophora hominis]|uniref:Uncharacterized protein n=1 Tax=Trachipleistophora hominis TaxID=72359 RepID=L7JU34_TRAHO|nr:putative proteins of PilT/Vapc superfamily [Trachipleistophora hominis]